MDSATFEDFSNLSEPTKLICTFSTKKSAVQFQFLFIKDQPPALGLDQASLAKAERV